MNNKSEFVRTSQLKTDSNAMYEIREIPEVYTDDKFFCNCFGVDVFEKDGELKSEFDYAKTL